MGCCCTVDITKNTASEEGRTLHASFAVSRMSAAMFPPARSALEKDDDANVPARWDTRQRLDRACQTFPSDIAPAHAARGGLVAGPEAAAIAERRAHHR